MEQVGTRKHTCTTSGAPKGVSEERSDELTTACPCSRTGNRCLLGLTPSILGGAGPGRLLLLGNNSLSLAITSSSGACMFDIERLLILWISRASGDSLSRERLQTHPQNGTNMKTCTYEGCYKRHEAKGLCKYHYEQRRRGSELTDLADLRLKQGRVLGSFKPYGS
jgi:hypothetical protein